MTGSSGANRPSALVVSPADEGESTPVIFGAPDIGEPEIDEVVDTLRSGWLGTGPKTKQFEFQFATYVGKRFAVGTNSGTAALHLGLDALEVGPGDEVITSPLTFVATANVIEHCGATPVFADVRWWDGNIDPREVEHQVTDRTRAILPVHYTGAVSPVGEIRSRLPDVPLVVDAAHAVEARFDDGSSSAGCGSSWAAYSFYVTKNIVTGEGGMLVTDDEEIAATARIRGLHGLDNDAWSRYASGRFGTYELKYPGFKYNMTDIQASLGIHQLHRIEGGAARRKQIWERYTDAFADLEGFELPPVSLAPDRHGRHARHLYTLRCNWDVLGITRPELVTALRQLGVGTGWHFPPVHLEPFYRSKYGYSVGDFPVAESIGMRTLSLPLSTVLSDESVDRVIAAVRYVNAHESA